MQRGGWSALLRTVKASAMLPLPGSRGRLALGSRDESGLGQMVNSSDTVIANSQVISGRHLAEKVFRRPGCRSDAAFGCPPVK